MGQEGHLQEEGARSAADQISPTVTLKVKTIMVMLQLYWFPYSEQRTYLDKVKQERQVKEEAMSQDEEEDIPVTEKEMSLKVRCII